MKNWEKFELDCVEYLNQQYDKYAVFRHEGGCDSTISDIIVNTYTGNTFYIEVKSESSQCGQFVLIPNINTACFEYSKKNAKPINDYTKIIMNHINNSYEDYIKAGSKGKNIDFPNNENIFSQWIIDYYSKKNVKFFISKNFHLVPIEEFSNYFYVSATLRTKKSGSKDVGKKSIELVLNYLTNHYKILNHRVDSDKLFIKSEQNLDKNVFSLDGDNYMFSLSNDEYRIRKLSHTNNYNVIFSIKYKENMQGLLKTDFISYLQK